MSPTRRAETKSVGMGDDSRAICPCVVCTKQSTRRKMDLPENKINILCAVEGRPPSAERSNSYDTLETLRCFEIFKL